VAGDLPGGIAFDLLRSDYFDDHPLRTIADYSEVTMPNRLVVLDHEVQEDEMNTLKGLGYVGEGVAFDAGSTSGEYDFWAADERLVAGHIASEIVYYLLQGEQSLAEEALALIQANRPEAVKRAMVFSRQTWERLMERVPSGAIDPEPFEAFFAEQ
jgi:hypothetical protein